MPSAAPSTVAPSQAPSAAAKYRPPFRSPAVYVPSAARVPAVQRLPSFSEQPRPLELVQQQQTSSTWRKPEPKPGSSQSVAGLNPELAIKQQMRCDGLHIQDRVASSKPDRFEKGLKTGQGAKFHLVGTPDGLMCRGGHRGDSGLLVIKLRITDRSAFPDSLSFDAAMQLQGYMIIYPGASHVEFVQGWQIADGTYKYHVKKLYEMKHPETKALLAHTQMKIISALKSFVSVLHDLRCSPSVQDEFVRLCSPSGQASWLASRLL